MGTYNSLVKLTSPLSPIVEKIGSMASPAADQVLGLKAGIEAKVPDVVSTGFNSALARVTSAAVSLDARLKASHAGALRLHQGKCEKLCYLRCHLPGKFHSRPRFPQGHRFELGDH